MENPVFLRCCIALPVPAPRRGSGWEAAAALVELLLRNGDLLRVGGGRGRLLGFGWFGYFFFFLKMLFHHLSPDGLGLLHQLMTKAVQNPQRRLPLSLHEAVSAEGFASSGALVQPWEPLWLPKSGIKL